MLDTGHGLNMVLVTFNTNPQYFLTMVRFPDFGDWCHVNPLFRDTLFMNPFLVIITTRKYA